MRLGTFTVAALDVRAQDSSRPCSRHCQLHRRRSRTVGTAGVSSDLNQAALMAIVDGLLDTGSTGGHRRRRAAPSAMVGSWAVDWGMPAPGAVQPQPLQSAGSVSSWDGDHEALMADLPPFEVDDPLNQNSAQTANYVRTSGERQFGPQRVWLDRARCF